MTFTATQIADWLSELRPRLAQADGSRWPNPTDLSAVQMHGATLDSRQSGPGVLFVGVQGETAHGAAYLGQALAQGSPAALLEAWEPDATGTAPVFVVDDARAALARLTRGYLSTFTPSVVGITGSNGKTTTKDFLRSALATQRAVGANPGNLNSGWGLPVAVLGQRGDEDVVVLEMGASRPGEIRELADLAGPTVGCITNIAPAHLEGFGSVERVVDTKAGLLDALPSDGVAILPADDDHLDALLDRARGRRVVKFGHAPDADVRIEACEQHADGLAVTIQGESVTLPVFGEANALNAAAAAAMASELGVSLPEALQGMTASTLSPHRSTVLTQFGRIILDDCYNANPGSMTAALKSLAAMPTSGVRWAVLGSMAELGEDSDRYHREVVELARELQIDRLVPFGEAMQSAANLVWPDQANSVSGATLANDSTPGDVLLFKGSRSAALETVLAEMVAGLSTGGID